jgi:predicted DNA binding CopG/RHH family protein
MAKKKNPFKNLKLDPEERQLLRSLDRGEWKTVDNYEAERKRYQAYAHYTLEKLRKVRRVNIRLTQLVLDGVQRKAREEGLPYQTLMASVLHKYVTGLLVEKRL